MGIALMQQITATQTSSSSIVKMKKNRTVEALVLTVEIGQRPNMILAQMAT